MGTEGMARTGRAAERETFTVSRRAGDAIVALAGNPNVGKSTVFNALTGLRQHTGNWPGKTVVSAQGRCEWQGREYLLVDTPGSYSLMAHSAEEEAARDFICFGEADAVVVVCDASCLERNLNLVLQTLEITDRVVLCVNLMDEARQRGVTLDLAKIEERLGIPVVPTAARDGRGLAELMGAVANLSAQGQTCRCTVRYSDPIEQALAILTPAVSKAVQKKVPAPRWLALRLLEGDEALCGGIDRFLGYPLSAHEKVAPALREARQILERSGVTQTALRDEIAASVVREAQEICADAVCRTPTPRARLDARIDRLLTSRRTGFLMMVLLLIGVFWLTITGANVPSRLLADSLFWLGDRLSEWLRALSAPEWLRALSAPEWLRGMLVDGAYRVLAWVVSVMLPPMAIFFPLFTLLEDLGYLPRVAFNLDHCFQKCRACGKQALTMAMGFGCNAAGVVGCRIIDSPRERLIAILTNSFVPCNGRFPILISILTMFFVGAGALSSLKSAVLLTAVIVLGVAMTLLMSRLLSATVLKGMPSSFTLELPPYRKPRIGQVILRSVLDRTLFVLGRAAMVAAPAGLIIWLCANVQVGGASILAHCTEFLDPFAHLLGLDGVILMAFILGFPANEIVMPIVIMAYLAGGSLVEMSDLSALRTLLVSNGWTPLTAICTMLFSLMHWPCSTTCLTMGKETGSAKWTLLGVVVPTAAGMVICAAVAAAGRLLGLG